MKTEVSDSLLWQQVLFEVIEIEGIYVKMF